MRASHHWRGYGLRLLCVSPPLASLQQHLSTFVCFAFLMGQKKKRKRGEVAAAATGRSAGFQFAFHSAVLPAVVSEEEKALKKLRFCTEAVASKDRFVDKVVIEDDLTETLQWLAESTPQEVILLSA